MVTMVENIEVVSVFMPKIQDGKVSIPLQARVEEEESSNSRQRGSICATRTRLLGIGLSSTYSSRVELMAEKEIMCYGFNVSVLVSVSSILDIYIA